MSGFVDPVRTATPTPTRARGQLAIGRDLALLDEGFDDGSTGHRDIHDLTVEDAPPDLGGWRENDRDLVLASAFERPREFG
jgi:hypothetical protein